MAFLAIYNLGQMEFLRPKRAGTPSTANIVAEVISCRFEDYKIVGTMPPSHLTAAPLVTAPNGLESNAT